MNLKRVRTIREGTGKQGPVVYWMSRDQRIRDNWALLYAQEIALDRKVPLIVVFCFVPRFLDAALRQYDFMLRGLKEVGKGLRAYTIPFCVLTGPPPIEIPRFVASKGAGVLVTDFDPLRIKREWKRDVAEKIAIPLYEVDARNIIPCWVASPKREYGAYTLRPKIHRALPEFLDEFPLLKKHPFSWKGKIQEVDWKKTRASFEVDTSPGAVDWAEPGEKAARGVLGDFIESRLSLYGDSRNDPLKDGQSNLSPYLHFGQISAQRVALEVMESEAMKLSREAFMEELIVRRELSDNFCYYNSSYDRFEGFPEWAKKTLDKHRKDSRQYIYSLEEFETARTHDELWNAAQTEMMRRGKMHGYLRMYWAKKLLEWTESPEEALQIAVYLNDRYELDGRDTNGYAGIAWSIGGVHDRAWPERPVFGKIRYMSYGGCKAKFNVRAYVDSVSRIEGS